MIFGDIYTIPRSSLLTLHFHSHHCRHHSFLFPGSFICRKEGRIQIYPELMRDRVEIISSLSKVNINLALNTKHQRDQDSDPPTTDERPKNTAEGPSWTLQDGQPGAGLGSAVRVMKIRKGGGIRRLEVSGAPLGHLPREDIVASTDCPALPEWAVSFTGAAVEPAHVTDHWHSLEESTPILTNYSCYT